jgi:hypothetical protein
MLGVEAVEHYPMHLCIRQSGRRTGMASHDGAVPDQMLCPSAEAYWLLQQCAVVLE